VFLADRDPDGDLRDRSSLHAVPLAGGEVVPLPGPGGPVRAFAFEPDGGIVCLAHPREPEGDDEHARLYRIDPDGGLRCLSTATEDALGPGADYTDLTDWHLSSEAPGRVTFVADRGRVRLVRFADDRPEPLLAGDVVVLSAAAAAGRVVALVSVDGPPEVFAVEGGRLRRLTREGRWLPRRWWPVLEEIDVPGPAGAIQTFLWSPPGTRGTRATVLDVHGGPTAQWDRAPMIETLLLVNAGYRVAMPNIRGSIGRGRAWVRALHGRWGDVDAADCHAVLDHLVEAGLADRERLGVLGLSYGGFMANWLVATSGRFAAVVSENGVANQVSAWAGSDCGPEYGLRAGLGDPLSPDGVARLWRQSPLAHVSSIATPLLLLQGEADHRCPPSDSEQLFVALRRLRRTVEYVLYPESAHTYSATGRPDRRIDRHGRVLDWFGRFMPV
jgi:dipeptidyl aminopeptidase/acylaminoacyl peptidase